MDIATVLTSTVLAAAVSASVSAAFQVIVKNKEFRNEYYKIVIAKRVKAVEAAEGLLPFFSSATVIADDNEKEFFTFLLVSPNPADDKYAMAAEAVGQLNIWLSTTSARNANQLVNAVGRLRYDVEKIGDVDGKIDYCAKVHPDFISLKLALQQSIANDMIKLHDVKAFLKTRRGDTV